MGDLNFRLEEGTFDWEQIVAQVRKGQLRKLIEVDQLSKARQSELAFYELTDTEPTFAPTYKFVIGSSDYDQK